MEECGSSALFRTPRARLHGPREGMGRIYTRPLPYVKGISFRPERLSASFQKAEAYTRWMCAFPRLVHSEDIRCDQPAASAGETSHSICQNPMLRGRGIHRRPLNRGPIAGSQAGKAPTCP